MPLRQFWLQYDLDRSTMQAEVDPAGVQTHDLLIMTVHKFHVTETSILTIRPSVMCS